MNSKKQQCIDFLNGKIDSADSRYSDRSINSILSVCDRIAIRIGINNENFYGLSGRKHLQHYHVLSKEFETSSFSKHAIYVMKFSYRNLLEFHGLNPDPINRYGKRKVKTESASHKERTQGKSQVNKSPMDTQAADEQHNPITKESVRITMPANSQFRITNLADGSLVLEII